MRSYSASECKDKSMKLLSSFKRRHKEVGGSAGMHQAALARSACLTPTEQRTAKPKGCSQHRAGKAVKAPV